MATGDYSPGPAVETDSVKTWLQQLGLSQYADVFAENAIDHRVLPDLSEADLEKLGILMGHRKILLKAISALAPELGAPGGTASSPIPYSAEAERRNLTVMFCDLAGSTALAEALDPEDVREVIRSFQDACAGIVSRYEGYIARYMGDGILVYFGFPRAHEDAAERAVRAALGIVSAVGRLEAPHGDSLQVRIGIATGLAVVGDIIGSGAAQEQAAVGETPNLAARLQSIAAPDSVVISVGTRELLGGQFNYEELGEQILKGIEEPVQVWAVTGERVIASRFDAARAGHLTAFVGRDQEVGLLLERWRLASASEGQVVLLSGEAGIGKSRITDTLRERLAGTAHLHVLYQCSPYHTNSALHPAIIQLGVAADLVIGDTAERKLEKLEDMLAQTGTTSKESTSLLADLLSLPAEERYGPLEMMSHEQKGKTLLALVEQIADLSARQPVLFVLEDAHWIDPTTQELMELIIHRAQDLRVLVVITFRPEFEPPWASHGHCTTLTLNRLSRAQCVALISQVTAGRELPGEVLEQIILKTDGVPLFLEELTKAVLESGLLAEDHDHYVLQGPLPAMAIPATLQDSLLSRLDRLEQIKEIAQIGAAIGREFPHRLLTAVVPMADDEMRHALERLVGTGLVFRRGAPPDATYVFKHALVQDTAYETLLRSRRQQIHERIARVLEAEFSDRVANEPEVLAHHFTQAGLSERAAPQWLRAGRRALALSANDEAIAHLTRGVGILDGLPQGVERDSLEVDLQTALALACMARHGYGAKETERAYLRAHELLAVMGEDPRIFGVLHGLCALYGTQVNLGLVSDYAEELLERAVRSRDSAAICVGHRCLAIGHNWQGEFATAFEHATEASRYYEEEVHRDSAQIYGHDIGVAALMHQAMAAWFLGELEHSAKAADQAQSLADRLTHPNTLAYSYLWAGFIHLAARDMPAAIVVSESMMRFGEERSMLHWAANGRCMLGAAKTTGEQVESAVDLLRSGMETLNISHYNLMRPTYLCFEAEGLAKLGRFDAALERIENAMAIVQATRERWWEAELHRVKAEVRQSMGAASSEVKSGYTRAIDVAQTQQAKLFELRATISLASVWRDEGKHKESRSVLEPVYSRFSQDFGSPDLIDAKALLDEL